MPPRKQFTTTPLPDLPQGQPAVIAAVAEDRAELIEIGFAPGATVTPTHSALGGDPRVYELDGCLVALRRAVARYVSVIMPEPTAQEGD